MPSQQRQRSGGGSAEIVRWAALLVGAAVASLAIGFVVGLAQPRPALPASPRD